jgi:hypothetical protein
LDGQQFYALPVEDLTETPDGYACGSAAASEEGQGTEITILRRHRLHPVEACRHGLPRRRLAAGRCPVSHPRRQGRHRGAVTLCRLASDQTADRHGRPGSRRPRSGPFAGQGYRSGQSVVHAMPARADDWRTLNGDDTLDGRRTGVSAEVPTVQHVKGLLGSSTVAERTKRRQK